MALKLRCFKIFDFIQCLEVKSYGPLEYERGETQVSVWPHQQTGRFKSLHLHLPKQIR